MTTEYQLREQARADLAAIWQSTTRHWGKRQADRYYNELIACFKALARDLYLGKTRDEVKLGYRSFPQGRHVVFYVVTTSAVEIIGILHQSEDVETHFENAD